MSGGLTAANVALLGLHGVIVVTVLAIAAVDYWVERAAEELGR